MKESHTRDTFVTAVLQLGVKEGMWDAERMINRNILQSMLNWAREQVQTSLGFMYIYTSFAQLFSILRMLRRQEQLLVSLLPLLPLRQK